MKILALALALIATLLPIGCAQMSAVDKASLHNTHVATVVLRPRVYRGYAEDAPASYEATWDGIQGVLLRLDTKFNGPLIATSTALIEVPTDTAD